MTVQPLQDGLKPILPASPPFGGQTADRQLLGSAPASGATGDRPVPSWEAACSCPEDCPRDHPNE